MGILDTITQALGEMFTWAWILFTKGGQDVMDKMQQEKVAAKKAAMADAMAESTTPPVEGV